MNIVDLVEAESDLEDRCVVRLLTSVWSDKRGINIKRKLSYLRKRSAGYNILQEEVDQIGAKEVVQNIVNLAQCEDGVYRVIICNARRDWETGYIDEYDLKLIPYTD